MNKIKLLITGHKGYIGTHLCGRLRGEGIEFVGVDNKDILNDYRLVADNEIETVIHLAALVSVKDSFISPNQYIEHNASGLLRFLYNNKIGRFIFASTCAVYGNTLYAKEYEANYSKCLSPYAQSKYLAEQIIYAMCPNNAIVRLGNVVGGNEDVRGYASAVKHFKKDSPITIYGVNQTRDFVDIYTVVNVLMKLLFTDIQGPINVGSGQPTDITTLACRYASYRRVSILREPKQVNDTDYICLNIDRAQSLNLL